MAGAALFLLALLAYAPALASRELVFDDRWIVSGNFLLGSWAALPRLLASGYWEGALGSGAPVQEFRPALMLLHFLNHLAFGGWAPAYHAVNALLHGSACVLAFRLIGRLAPRELAFAAAALFAVLPVHCEAVAWVSGRSELLAAVFLLAAWLRLESPRPRLAAGLGAFSLALLSKETALVFPAVLALHDWAFHGLRFWSAPRSGLYLRLLLCAAGYWLLRAACLSRVLHGGFGYFEGRGALTRLLTLSRFAARHYLLPMASGVGLQSDFSRPFFPDATTSDPAAWLCLAGWAALLLWAARALLRRRSPAAPASVMSAGAGRVDHDLRPGFWILAAFLFLLPASNLLVGLDAIGAQRFLYLPSLSFCVLLAAALSRLPPLASRAALAALLAGYGGLAASRSLVWATERSYYAEAVRQNPRSAGALSGLGTALLREGRETEGVPLLRRALQESPRHPAARYNLGVWAWSRGDAREAERHLLAAEAGAPGDADAQVLLGAIAERRGLPKVAALRYRRALDIRPWDARAHYNLGRLLWAWGLRAPAGRHFQEFLRLAPGDPDTQAIRNLLASPAGDPRN